MRRAAIVAKKDVLASIERRMDAFHFELKYSSCLLLSNSISMRITSAGTYARNLRPVFGPAKLVPFHTSSIHAASTEALSPNQ